MEALRIKEKERLKVKEEFLVKKFQPTEGPNNLTKRKPPEFSSEDLKLQEGIILKSDVALEQNEKVGALVWEINCRTKERGETSHRCESQSVYL